MNRALLAIPVVFLAACSGMPVPISDAGEIPPVIDAGTDGGCDLPTTNEAGVVITTAGALRGVQEDGAWAYRGIPFAAPPVGELRFRAPTETACWSGVRDASTFGSACLQVSFTDDGGSQILGDEDCLVLNVWAPTPDAGVAKPVLFFIHGGGNQSGSTSNSRGGITLTEGSGLVVHEDVVVVTTQYRLGPLGFLARASLVSDAGVGNYGLLDQQAALRWVKNNIAAFGGDPTRVMVFGESAGALNTCSLLASPGSAGLFAAAGVESGACIAAPSAVAFTQAAPVVTAANCLNVADEAACLRAASTTSLLSTVDPVFEEGFVTPLWSATIDGVTLTDAPLDVLQAGQGQRVPVLVGSNADETSIVAPAVVTPAMVEALLMRFQEPLRSQFRAVYPPGTTNMEAKRSYIALSTDSQFTCNARRLARALQSTQPVYRYLFNHRLPGTAGVLGAFHGAELFYVFRGLERSPLAAQMTDGDRFVMNALGAYWSSLPRTGDVNVSGAVTWPRSNGNDELLELSPTPVARNGFRTTECDLWDSLR